MKTFKKTFIALLSLIVLSGCAKFHTGTVVIEDSNDQSKKSNLNVEYIVVDQKDKEILIKNIKEGKGAVITKNRYDENKNNNDDSNNDNDKNSNNNQNSNNSGNNGNR